MAKWKKMLDRMCRDTNPNGYRYDQAAAILEQLDFKPAKNHKGSHRKWRRKLASGAVVVVELVDAGSGTLKPYLIRDMISQLKDHGLTEPDPGA